MSFKTIAVSMLLPVIKEIGVGEVETALEAFKANNPAQLPSLLNTLNSGLSLLLPVTDKTATKVDDTLLSILLTSVQEIAAREGITLQ